MEKTGGGGCPKGLDPVDVLECGPVAKIPAGFWKPEVFKAVANKLGLDFDGLVVFFKAKNGDGGSPNWGTGGIPYNPVEVFGP